MRKIKFFGIFLFIFSSFLFLASCGNTKESKNNDSIEVTSSQQSSGESQSEDLKIFILSNNGKTIESLTDYGKSQSNIIIPNTIEIIGNYAFYHCENLKSVTIPDSVTTIGDYAFYYCAHLTNLKIENGVTSIGSGAFSGCTLLESITIPDSVTSIGNSAFYGCENLSYNEYDNAYYLGNLENPYLCLVEVTNSDIDSFVMNNKTKIIYGRAFYEFSNLKNITISNNVISIGQYAFYNCSNLNNFTIPNSVINIGESAFFGCKSLTNITIPDGVTSISNSAFGACWNLTNITIPDGVTTIGDFAFSSCENLTSIIIPASVTKIEDAAFQNCCRLVEVINKSQLSLELGSTSNGYVAYYAKQIISDESESKLLTDLNGFITYNDGTDTWLVNYIGTDTEITIPSNITKINDYAFYEYTNLTSITISDSVTSIGKTAFYDCKKLTSITIPVNVTSIGDSAFNCQRLVEVINKSSLNITKGSDSYGYIAKYAKQVISDEKDSKLSTDTNGFITYNDGTDIWLVNYIGNDTKITIPSNITKINEYAFYNCSLLTSVAIHNSVTTIGESAFYGCTSLKNIILPNGITKIEVNMLRSCSSLMSITIPDSVTSIGGYALAFCSSLTSITIPNSVTSIEYSAFDRCTSLKSITIPNSVTSIGNSAFYGCENLSYNEYDNAYYLGNLENPYLCLVKSSNKNVENCIVNSNTKIIHSNAFTSCGGLISIILPDGIISIGSNVFSGCNSLSYNEYDNAYYLGNSENPYLCLIKCLNEKIENCVVNNNTKIICDFAFSYCSDLISITIPASVTSIGNAAFLDCSRLVEVINKSSLNITKGSDSYGYIAKYAKQVISDEKDSKLSTDSNGFITYNDGTDIWLVNYIGTDTEITIPSNITRINDYAFYNYSSLTSVAIHNSVTTIGESAFNRCKSLKNIILPNGITKIEVNMLRGCSSLMSITIPDSVTSIGIGAFYICSSLANISIPDNVTSIGYSAFDSCYNLEKVYYKGTSPYTDTITSIGQYNTELSDAVWYYFTSNGASETNSGNWWYYDTDGETIIEKVIE